MADTPNSAKELQQHDFVESLFYKDLEVSPELYAYVRAHQGSRIDHAETSFYDTKPDMRLIQLTLPCVEDFFVEIGKRLGKTGYQIFKMWVQKYGRYNYHAIHTHAPDAFNYSFVFYVDCTDQSGCTMFYNVGYPYVDHSSFKVQPVKGRCVVFPGAMPHEAMPNQDDRRMIVSGNLFYFDREKYVPGQGFVG
jgi:hypothetical protein